MVGILEGARGAVLASVVVIGALVASCVQVEPETGDRRPECVDVDSDPATPVSFTRDIRPLMNGGVPGTKGCKGCHYASDPAGTREGFLETQLNLETLKTLRAGGIHTPPGRIVVPGKPCSSAIVQKLQGTFGNCLLYTSKRR